MALIYFTLYQPKIATLKADLQASEAQLTSVTRKLAKAETDLALAETNRETADTTVTELTDQLLAADLFSSIYKFQADVNAARVALLKLDPASSLQALNFIKTDLAELEKQTSILTPLPDSRNASLKQKPTWRMILPSRLPLWIPSTTTWYS